MNILKKIVGLFNPKKEESIIEKSLDSVGKLTDINGSLQLVESVKCKEINGGYILTIVYKKGDRSKDIYNLS